GARPAARPQRGHPADEGPASRGSLTRSPAPKQPISREHPMAAGDTQITLVGNLVDDPELRFTPSGQAVAKFRVASTPRYMDRQTNEWKDGESLFLTCNVWRQAAE